MISLTQTAPVLKTAEEIATLETVRAFLYREARLLDDRQFDEWLECYHPDS
jgi:benzoate/toluate 1,2-dioxygenase beta subunit